MHHHMSSAQNPCCLMIDLGIILDILANILEMIIIHALGNPIRRSHLVSSRSRGQGQCGRPAPKRGHLCRWTGQDPKVITRQQDEKP